MSRRALLLSVRSQLRDLPQNGGLVGAGGLAGVGFLAEEIDLTLLGRPHPRMGQRFIGVHAGPAKRTQQVSVGLDRTFEVLVTVSMKLSVPPDRIGDAMLEKDTLGFDDLCELVTKCVHADSFDRRISNRANATLGYSASDDATPRPFDEALEYLGDTGPQEVGEGWFGGDDRERTLAGVKCVLRFGGSRRVQTYIGPSAVTLLPPNTPISPF